MEARAIRAYRNVISCLIHDLLKQPMAVVSIKGNVQQIRQILVLAKRELSAKFVNQPKTGGTILVSHTQNAKAIECRDIVRHGYERIKISFPLVVLTGLVEKHSNIFHKNTPFSVNE